MKLSEKISPLAKNKCVN